jgi:hypothetical protein
VLKPQYKAWIAAQEALDRAQKKDAATDVIEDLQHEVAKTLGDFRDSQISLQGYQRQVVAGM